MNKLSSGCKSFPVIIEYNVRWADLVWTGGQPKQDKENYTVKAPVLLEKAIIIIK